MEYLRLGKTELTVTKPSMGCLPLQRCTVDEAVDLLRAAYDGGIRFFDTANAYTDSEKKLGLALADVRGDIVIATKSGAPDYDGVLRHVENSLKMLKTDHVDLLQLHNPDEFPDPDDPKGAYQGALEAKRRGWTNHVGITAHRLSVAKQAIESGLYETLQFPFSYISAPEDLALAEACKQADMGFIAMKGLAGGLLTNAAACHAFMGQYDNVVPIWGIQRREELAEWLAVAEENPVMDDKLRAVIEADRAALSGTFCRSCGYCMPCPMGIEIRNCARMDMLLRRSPWQQYYTPEWTEKMERIEDCLGCGLCASRCPYGLNPPELMARNLADWRTYGPSRENNEQ